MISATKQTTIFLRKRRTAILVYSFFFGRLGEKEGEKGGPDKMVDFRWLSFPGKTSGRAFFEKVRSSEERKRECVEREKSGD